MPKQISGLKSSDFRPLRINMRLFPLDTLKLASMIYGVPKGETVSILCAAIRIIQCFCPFCGQNHETVIIDRTGRSFTVLFDKIGTPKQVKAFVVNTGFAPAIVFDPMLLP